MIVIIYLIEYQLLGRHSAPNYAYFLSLITSIPDMFKEVQELKTTAMRV